VLKNSTAHAVTSSVRTSTNDAVGNWNYYISLSELEKH